MRALRKAGVIPVLIWLAAFPAFVAGVGIWQKHNQKRLAIEALADAMNVPPDRVVVTSNTMWTRRDAQPGTRMRLMCGHVDQRNVAMRVETRSRSSEIRLRDWTFDASEPAATGSSEIDLLAECPD